VFLNCEIGATESSLRRPNRATRHRELYVGSQLLCLSVIEITVFCVLQSRPWEPLEREDTERPNSLLSGVVDLHPSNLNTRHE
jgi:hypothetical protein